MLQPHHRWSPSGCSGCFATVFQDVLRRFLLLFDTHLVTASPAGPAQGLVFCDNTDGVKLRWSSKIDSAKAYLPRPMLDKMIPSGSPPTRKKYTPAFKDECVRQVAAGARQTDVAHAQGLSPALLGR